MGEKTEKSRFQLHPPGWGCLMGLIALAFCVLVLPVLMPIAAIASWRDDYRLRRYYRRAKRLLSWKQAKQMMASGQGTFIFERHPKGIGRDVWWLEDNLRATDADCPAKELGRSGDWAEIHWMLVPKVKAWWEVRQQDFSNRVFYVQMPWNAWWYLQEMVSAKNAVTVEQSWTYSFRHS